MRYAPMLAKIGKISDLSKQDYMYEPKLDGTRAICYKNDTITLINRRGRDLTSVYPELVFIKNIDAKSCVLDGEIVIYDQKGIPNFNVLQKRDQLSNKLLIELRSEQYPATYVVFDILMKNGKSLVNLPLIERKKILADTVKDGRFIQKIFFSDNGKRLWKEVIKIKMEGVMAKLRSGKYFPGVRVSQWLKIKNLKTIDCIIVGFTQKKRIISALALGVYCKGKLTYIGKVGTGFTYDFLEDLHKKLVKLKAKKASVEYVGRENINWVKPELVCEVKYLELSKDNKLRAPSFIMLREDKIPKECILEDQI